MRSPYKEWFRLLIDICNRLHKYKRFKNRSMDHLYKTGLRFVLFHAFRLHSKTHEDEFKGLSFRKEDLSFIPQFDKTAGKRIHLSCNDPHFPEELYSEAVKYELKSRGNGIVGLSRIKSRRKSGVYYTPKVIVDHMIRETLNHLIRELPAEQFLNIKICDPAMGTGKFLFAAADYLEKEYNRLTKNRDPDLSKKIYASIVKKCIYGIDKDPIAYFLTISCFIVKSGVSADDLSNFFLMDTLLNDLPEDLKFDAVIGNPPWMTFGLRDVKKIDPDLNRILRKKYSATAEYKISVYSLFMEKALELTKRGGYHCFIVPDSWLAGRYFYKLRRFLLDNYCILRLVLISKDFWQGLSIGRCMIYTVRKEESKNADLQIDSAVLKDPEELKYVRKRNVGISGSRILKRKRSRIFLYRDDEERRIIEKMEDCGGRLGDHIRFYSGLIGKKGRKSIVINDVSPDSCFTDRGMLIESGRNLEREKLIFTGHYIVHDPALYKSGYDIRKYIEPKIFLNQTGDQLKAFYDDSGLFCLNNLHIGYGIAGNTDLRFITFLLNSRVMNYYYKVTSMEYGRALAQTDIDFLHELPFCRDKTIPRKITGILQRHLRSGIQIISSDHIEYSIELPPKYREQIEELLCEWYGVTIPEDYKA